MTENKGLEKIARRRISTSTKSLTWVKGDVAELGDLGKALSVLLNLRLIRASEKVCELKGLSAR